MAPLPAMGVLRERLHHLCTHLRSSSATRSGSPAATGAADDVAKASSLAAGSCRSLREGGASDEECAAHILEHGFLLVDDMLVGNELAAAQAAYTRLMEPARVQWLAAREQGLQKGDEFEGQVIVNPPSDGYFDIPRVVEHDDCFLDIVAHPRITGVLDKVIGPELQLLNIQCRSYPAQDPEIAAAQGGYAGWHNDRGYGVLFNNSRALHVVVMFYFWDTGVDDGCTSVVPDSHLIDDKSDLLASQQSAKGQHAQFAMPGMLACDRRAGSAVIFDER